MWTLLGDLIGMILRFVGGPQPPAVSTEHAEGSIWSRAATGVRSLPTTEPDRLKHSAVGFLSCLVGGLMLLVQFGVIAAVAQGVRDSQGIIYALTIPFFMYLVGVPLGCGLGIMGLRQAERRWLFSVLGLCLTLTGPLLFSSWLYRALYLRGA